MNSDFCLRTCYHFCIHTHAIWQIDWLFLIYHHSLCFFQNCIWYWTDMSAIPWCKLRISWRVFCIFSCCSWVLFKKEYLQIEHALLPKIVQLRLNLYRPFPGIIHIFSFKSAALLEERQMSRRTIFLHENGMQSWNMHLRIAGSRAFFQKILHPEHNLTFCSCFCEHEQIHARIWKIDSMLCTIAAFAKDKMGFRLSWTKNGCMLQYTPC